MIVKAESLKTRYQNVRQINTVLLSSKTIKLYSKLEKIKIYIYLLFQNILLYAQIYHYEIEK